jgi:hypothetical protein
LDDRDLRTRFAVDRAAVDGDERLLEGRIAASSSEPLKELLQQLAMSLDALPDSADFGLSALRTLRA